MVPKFRDVEITEFMTGFTVQSYTAQASSMNIYIPALMFDKTGGTNTSTISLSGNILVSRETIRIPSSLTDYNYITVKVSDLFRATYRALGREHATIPTGSKVRVYIPDLNIHEALIVPLV